LRLTYGDAHKDDHRRPFHRGTGSSNHHGNFKKSFRKPFKPRRFGTHVMDTVEEEECDEAQDYYNYPDEEEPYDDNHDEEYDDEHKHHEDDEHEQHEDDEHEDEDDDDDQEQLEQLWETFIQFVKAGKKLRSKSKGWRPKGKGKGKGKGKSKNPGNGMNGMPSTSGAFNSGKKTGKCLDCGKFGHWKGDPECEHVKS